MVSSPGAGEGDEGRLLFDSFLWFLILLWFLFCVLWSVCFVILWFVVVDFSR